MPGPFLVYNENASEREKTFRKEMLSLKQASKQGDAGREGVAESLEERGAGNAGVLWHAEKGRVAGY